MFRKMCAVFLCVLLLVGMLSCASADNAVITEQHEDVTSTPTRICIIYEPDYHENTDIDNGEHPYYFEYLSRLRFTNQNPLQMYGYNDKGQAVQYILHFEIPIESWMVDRPKVEALSWEEEWFNYISLDFWDKVRKGLTFAVVDIVYSSEVAVYTIDIYLPDNPALAPKQYFILSGMGDLIKVEFELSYQGNYQTGNGWKVYNVKRYRYEDEAKGK